MIAIWEPLNLCATSVQAMFAFVGEKFNTVPELQALKSIFLDFFRGQVVSNVMAKGLDRVILIVALTDTKVVFRHYKCSPPKKEGNDQVGYYVFSFCDELFCTCHHVC